VESHGIISNTTKRGYPWQAETVSEVTDAHEKKVKEKETKKIDAGCARRGGHLGREKRSLREKTRGPDGE